MEDILVHRNLSHLIKGCARFVSLCPLLEWFIFRQSGSYLGPLLLLQLMTVYYLFFDVERATYCIIPSVSFWATLKPEPMLRRVNRHLCNSLDEAGKESV